MTDTGLIAYPLLDVLMVQQGSRAYAPDQLGFEVCKAITRRSQLMSAYLRLGLSGVDKVSVQTY